MYLIDSARQETYAGFGFAHFLCVWFSKVKFWTSLKFKRNLYRNWATSALVMGSFLKILPNI